MQPNTFIMHYNIQNFDINNFLNKRALLMWKTSRKTTCEKYLEKINSAEKRLKKYIDSIARIEKKIK